MIHYNCPNCSKPLEVEQAYAGTTGACPFCGATVTAPRTRTSGWANASLACGLLGCLVLPALLAIPFGIIGIRQVNRSGGTVRGRGLAIAGLVLGCIFSLPWPVVLYQALSSAIHEANRMRCGPNLRSIGLAIKIYASQNNGHWPTVYSDPRTAAERWGPGFDSSGAMADRGTSGTTIGQHGPFTCNVSAWWLLVRAGMANPACFVCPKTDMEPDTTEKPMPWWSFQDIGNVSYSYQNQLGRNTNDNADATLIVAADRNPCRGDITKAQKGVDPKKRWLMNSPNHGFEGQNCLYADGHVEFNDTPNCGIRHNNIWLRSTWATPADSAAAEGPEAAPVEDTGSYGDGTSQVGGKDDSFLVP